MKNFSVTIPFGMLFKKFYCHHCGSRLEKSARKRTVRKGDPDYKKYRNIGDMYVIGDIEVTEYDFHCPSCGEITGYDEQCILGHIQKRTGGHILSSSEIAAGKEEATRQLQRKKTFTKYFWAVLAVAVLVLVLYLQNR